MLYLFFQELRKKHARELDALEQAHMDAKGESGSYRHSLFKRSSCFGEVEVRFYRLREAVNQEDCPVPRA